MLQVPKAEPKFVSRFSKNIHSSWCSHEVLEAVCDTIRANGLFQPVEELESPNGFKMGNLTLSANKPINFEIYNMYQTTLPHEKVPPRWLLLKLPAPIPWASLPAPGQRRVWDNFASSLGSPLRINAFYNLKSKHCMKNLCIKSCW